jgi:dTDP-4-amino-4,6-dideoxygalactose transaminase
MSKHLQGSSIGQVAGAYIDRLLAHPEAFRGQQLRGGGVIAEFEIRLVERTGFPFCLATSCATSALLVAALSAGLSGKKIAFERGAWEGSLGALEFAGVQLMEVDSLLNDLPGGISALLATDAAGRRHDACAVRALCDREGLLYLEDTGWLPGVSGPEDTFSAADLQVISFGPGKPLCLGEGGALLCRSKEIYEIAVCMSQHPERTESSGLSFSTRPPMNARIHPIAALLGTLLLS